MRLNDLQRAQLDGAEGPRVAAHLRRLVDWGEAMDARRLVAVDNVHCSTIGPIVIPAGQEGQPLYTWMVREIEQALAEPVRVPTATHVARVCMHDDKIEITPQMRAFHERVIALARRAGIQLTWTCAPYLIGVLPGKGQICAWTESSAVVFVNSVIGARSTRNGAESALAAAVTGWVPEFGVLLDEHRHPDLMIDVDEDALTGDPCDWGLLGYWAGEQAGLGSPCFVGPPSPSIEQAKQLSATLATGGGVSMFHVAGATPEAPGRTRAAADRRLPRLRYGRAERRSTRDKLDTLTGTAVDYVLFGCPHATLEEIRAVAAQLDGRRIAPSVRLEIWSSWAIHANAERLGHAEVIRNAGGFLMTDSCPAVSRIAKGRRMVTNAVKQAHYLQGMTGHEVAVGRLDEVIAAALTGRWSR
jgi:predicted aconitase